MKKTPVWETWLAAFIPVIFAPHLGELVFPMKASNSQDVLVGLIIRFGISLVGVIGTIVILILKHESNRALKAAALTAIDELPPDDNSRLHFHYENTRKSMWRCEMWTLFHRKESALPQLGMGIISGLTLGPAALLPLGLPLWATLILSALLDVIACFTLTIITTYLVMHFRLAASGGVRKLEGELTREGIISRRPEGINHLPWHSLSDFQFHDGDIFFRTGWNGIYFPREAFADRSTAKRFFELITALHASQGARWDELVLMPGYDLS